MSTHTFASLAPELEAFVADGVAAKVAERNPGAVGFSAFPGSTELITGFVRTVLDAAARNYGDEAEDFVLQFKEQFRTVIGPDLIELADRILHGMKDLKTS